jgi:hypothetical protein
MKGDGLNLATKYLIMRRQVGDGIQLRNHNVDNWEKAKEQTNKQTNSVALSPQANYTD